MMYEFDFSWPINHAPRGERHVHAKLSYHEVQDIKARYSAGQATQTRLAGIDKFRELIGKYHQCKMLDVWPGYNGLGDINEVFLPKWMQNGVEADAEE